MRSIYLGTALAPLFSDFGFIALLLAYRFTSEPSLDCQILEAILEDQTVHVLGETNKPTL